MPGTGAHNLSADLAEDLQQSGPRGQAANAAMAGLTQDTSNKGAGLDASEAERLPGSNSAAAQVGL